MKVLAYLAGAALALFVVPFLGAWLLAAAARKWGRDPHAETTRKPTYRFTGHDDALRQRTERRREDASAIRRQAVRLEASTQDEAKPRIHLVGGRS